MYERPEVLTGLHVDKEDRHHQVEAGSAEADSIDRRVAHQHLTMAPAVRLVTHHVEERHLKHIRHIYLPLHPACGVKLYNPQSDNTHMTLGPE